MGIASLAGRERRPRATLSVSLQASIVVPVTLVDASIAVLFLCGLLQRLALDSRYMWGSFIENCPYVVA